MLDALYTAASGMLAQQTALDVTANNLANVNTVGFKAGRTAFEDLLYSQLNPQAGAAQGNEMGLGTEVSAIQTQMDEGQAQSTGRALDLRVDGSGMLAVKQADGSIAYTRAGNLETDANGTLVTVDGDVVQPKITIPTAASDVSIDAQGVVSVMLKGKLTKVGQLQVAQFQNPGGLQPIGSNKYLASVNSGTAQLGKPGLNGAGSIRSGELEMSNVNAVDEMVSMISTQRAYEGVSKVVQASDEMLNTANQLRR